MQEMGGRRQEAGDRGQDIGGRRQDAGDRMQEAGDRRQEEAFFPNVFFFFVKQSNLPRSVGDFIATFHQGFIRENLFISIFE